jgi:DNA topoisomerase-1
LQKKIAQTEQKIEKMKLDMKIKDDLKTVALGTSKINYMDPRITVAWCKRNEVPIEKVSSSITLLHTL